ncbi:MAG: tetratricopeptide repeat protein [Clostridiales bacterium]|nr:tetratricopeptide repeat protein [Clostridiales bacterium]
MDDNHEKQYFTPPAGIKIRTSVPGLMDKIHTSISPDASDIYWYIKFNIPLDEKTVSEKTMDVTDTEGYIMRTDISYNNSYNTIVISPLDSYEQNIYYLLNISKKVKSVKGQNLKSEIHILFKLLNNKISDYKVLKSTAKIPKRRPRPKDYEARLRAGAREYPNTKIYSFEQQYANMSQDQLPPCALRVNFWAGLAGLALMAVTYFFVKNWIAITAALALCAACAVYIITQLMSRKNLSVLLYNRGKRKFYREEYESAAALFKQALQKDPDNEMAEFALNKVAFYVKT